MHFSAWPMFLVSQATLYAEDLISVLKATAVISKVYQRMLAING